MGEVFSYFQRPVYVPERQPVWIQLIACCPQFHCQSKRKHEWICKMDGKSLYISDCGIIECRGRGKSHAGRVVDWDFNCNSSRTHRELFENGRSSFETDLFLVTLTTRANTDFKENLSTILREQIRYNTGTEHSAVLYAIAFNEDTILKHPLPREISSAKSCRPQLSIKPHSQRDSALPDDINKPSESRNDVWIELEMICPNNNCYSESSMTWICSKDNQSLYINSNGIIKCTGSQHSHSGKVIDWTFSCCITCFTYPGDNEDFESIWSRSLGLTHTDFASKLKAALFKQKRSGRNSFSDLIAIQEKDFSAWDLFPQTTDADDVNFETDFSDSDEDENEYVDYSEHFNIHEFDFTKRTPPTLFEDGQISDSAKDTCNTIVAGFEMTVSQHILFEGSVGTESFEKTENATRLLMDITSKKDIWYADKKKAMRCRIFKLQELLTAIANKDHDEVMKIYYRSQHIHTFDGQSIPLKVHIYVEKDRLNYKWLPHIQNTINKITIAAPGIQFIRKYQSLRVVGSTNYIEIGIDDPASPETAYTSCEKGYPFIHLGGDWPPEKMEGTSTHEMLHALGFGHVMTRFDSHLYLEVNTVGLSEEEAHQYKSNPSYGMLTRFDPFSIMMYSENEKMKRAKGDQIWHLKEGPERYKI